MGDENRVKHRADDAHVALRSDADARSKARLDGELGGIFAGDEETAFLNKLLQMGKAFVTQSRANVGGAIGGAEVWSQLRFLPRHWIIPEGNAVENFSVEERPTGAKTMTSYFA